MRDIECDIPLNFIDRSHWVGKKHHDIIVIFFFLLRPYSGLQSLEKFKEKIRIGLDLTASK